MHGHRAPRECRFNGFYLAAIFIVWGFVFSPPFLPRAEATVYQPGATLEPDCAPGSSNCGVATYPSFLGTSAPIGNSLLTIQATGTASVLATLRAFTGQAANLFQVQDSLGSNIFSINSSGGLILASPIGVTYGGTGLSGNPSYGSVLVGNSSGGYMLMATSSLGISGGGGSGTVTSIGLSAPTGLTVAGSPVTSSGTLALSLTPGYIIPLSASTTEYDNAYANRITSVSSPLSISNHALSLSTAGDWTGTFDGQEGLYYLNANNLNNFGAPFYTFFSGTTTTALAEGNNLYFTNTRFDNRLSATTTLPNVTTLAGLSLPATQLTNFGTPFYTFFSATTTDALAQGSVNKYYSTNLFAGSLAGTTTTALAEGSNLYFTNNRVASVLAGTTTTALAEGSNLYFTDTRADNRINATSSISTLTTLSNLVATGALTSGSIGSGFGNINIGSNTFTGNGSGLTNLNANNLTNFGAPFFAYFSATTTDALSQGSLNKYYSDALVNSFVHSSSTIPKTYAANIFTGGNTFNGGLTVSSLNGPLQANGGLVSATTSIGVLYGGTGLTVAPSYGQLLVGNGNGGYALAATSTLGLGSSSGTVSSVDVSGGTTGLSFSGGPVTSSGTLTLGGLLNVANGGTGAASFGQGWIFSSGGTSTLSASTSPTINYITATSTTATSTFANGINITGGCFAKDGVCIGGSGGGGSDLQSATSFLSSDVALGTGATSTLTTVNVTPSAGTGDVFVQAEVSIRSASNTDGTAVIAVRKTDCTGTILASAGDVITEGNGVGASSLFVTAVDVDAGASLQTYALCGSAVTQGHTATDYSLSATVIDTGADLAEIYATNDESLAAGDVVSLDPNLKTGVKKSEGVSDMNVIGIVSTKPGQVIGGVGAEGVKAVPVALSGRVPVRVVTENGAIVPGDYLAPSSLPGVAMKAGEAGVIIGQAIGRYEGEGVGVVLAFVKNFNRNEENSFSGNMEGLSSFVETVSSESPENPVDVVSEKITEGKKFAVDFVAARMTALRGYFGELFADKMHAKQICLEKSGGSEICFNGDDAAALFENANRNAVSPVEPVVVSEPVEEVPVITEDATSTVETTADESEEIIQ